MPEQPFPRVVVVYGALRSGTTMFRLMLDGHPALVCPSESDFLFDYTEVDVDGTVRLDLDAIQRDRISQAALGQISDQGSDQETFQHILDKLAGGSSDTTLVLILHRGIRKFRRLFPDAPVIHMMRDPRDVARSGIGFGWAGNVYCGVSHWIDTETEWDQAFGQALKVDGVFDLHHETLVEAPEPTLRSLCDFLGIAWSDLMLDYASASTYEAPNKKYLHQWKQKLSEQEIGLIEGRVAPMLTARGYVLSGLPIQKPGFVHRLWLILQSKAFGWRHRISRYGLFDPLLIAISRRCGIPSIGYAAQERLDAKHIRYLK